MPISFQSVRESAILPSAIRYTETANSQPQKFHKCWNYVKAPLEAVGQILRNALYLPLYQKKIDPELKLDQRLARHASRLLQRTPTSCSEELQTIQRYFDIRDITVTIDNGSSIEKIFTVRLFESKIPIGEKKLRIILFSFNNNLECENKTKFRMWNPLNIKEVSKAPLSVLQAFQACGVRVDSLMNTSLGNVVFDGLEPSTPSDIIPSTIILNRGLTSVRKVANQLYSFPFNYMLHGIAKLCGWDADPEKKFLNYLETTSQNSAPRKVVIIEALGDFYFSGEGALDANIHEKIDQLGIQVFRAKFWPFPFHSRSHHALSLDHLKRNIETRVLTNTMSFQLDQEETMSSAIAKNVFFEGSNEWHTCFYIGGSEATLDTGMLREVTPLLSAFIRGNADDRKELDVS